MTGILDGKFRLTKTLGSGFSAKVKLAFDEEGNEFAIKIFDLENTENSKRQMELIKQEVDATIKLNHRYICRYHEFQENTILQKIRNG